MPHFHRPALDDVDAADPVGLIEHIHAAQCPGEKQPGIETEARKQGVESVNFHFRTNS